MEDKKIVALTFISAQYGIQQMEHSNKKEHSKALYYQQ